MQGMGPPGAASCLAFVLLMLSLAANCAGVSIIHPYNPHARRVTLSTRSISSRMVSLLLANTRNLSRYHDHDGFRTRKPEAHEQTE